MLLENCRRAAVGKRTKIGLITGIALAIAATNLIAQRTLTAPLSPIVEIKDLTWVEVHSAIQAGHTTVIVPTGGIEQNGPHMIVGKHDYIVGWAAAEIARGLGRTLVAPVVSYVPQGAYEPPAGHLRFAGTIGVPELVFDGMLDGIARSLRAGGFKTICFIGDHGGNQAVQKQVAERLSRAWAAEGVRVVHIDAYYDDSQQIRKLVTEGETPARIGLHAGIIDTSELMAIHPAGVDLGRYVRPTLIPVTTGVSGNPTTASAIRGRELIAMRIAAAVRQIKALVPTQ
jgi:creatinine amidohydrolase